MAPIDRREHRQQRVRGAGTTSVQGTFGFNIGSLAARPAQQKSLPPRPSSRRTPVRATPRAANGSAQRHRSASVQRSGSAKPKSATKSHTPSVTPHLGKRKRGSTHAQTGTDEGEDDELTPNREELERSIEKSRRVIGAVSPIHEEVDDAMDELSVLQGEGSTARKRTADASVITNGTPVSVLANKRMSNGTSRTRTPIADRIGGMSTTSRRSNLRRSRSTELGPTTPSFLPNGRPRVSSASRFGPAFDTPNAAQNVDESEDELSPPQLNGTTPRVVTSEPRMDDQTGLDNTVDVDELSSPMQPAPSLKTPTATVPARQQAAKPPQEPEEQTVTSRQAKRGRPRRIVQDDDDTNDTTVAAPAKPAKRGRPRKSQTVQEAIEAATPAEAKVGRNIAAQANNKRMADEDIDELSPDKNQPSLSSRKVNERQEIRISDGEESDEYEEPELEESLLPTPRPPTQQRSPKRPQQVRPSSEKPPPRKRHKFLGPKHAISVMRIKGSAVRGITVADTTRTILEETIDYRLARMAEKMQTAQDSDQRKELRSEINLSLSFKESLNEKLLDLQDANDVLSTNLKKMKLFKRDNAELRKEILTLQNNRQEIALEHDDVQMQYEAEKAKADAKNQLSANMFEIEAAIQNGRKRARNEGREDEGPDLPLAMLLDMVGRDVGSFGSGLLSKVKGFNGTLERAAGWLEGRV